MRVQWAAGPLATQFLIPLWKLRSDALDLKPLLERHLSEMEEIRLSLSRETRDLLNVWTGSGDTSYQERVLAHLHSRIKTFTTSHSLRAQAVIKKLNRFRASYPKGNNGEFFARLGITEHQVTVAISEVNRMLVTCIQASIDSTGIGNRIHWKYTQVVMRVKRRQETWWRIYKIVTLIQILVFACLLGPMLMKPWLCWCIMVPFKRKHELYFCNKSSLYL